MRVADMAVTICSPRHWMLFDLIIRGPKCVRCRGRQICVCPFAQDRWKQVRLVPPPPPGRVGIENKHSTDAESPPIIS